MKKSAEKNFCWGMGLLLAFALWTAAVRHIDVQAIGPEGSCVGFASLNGWFHGLTGVHMFLYTLTDWLGLVPLCFAAGFACLGLAQWIRRRSLRKMDGSILALGGFYAAVLAAYLFFEWYVVNYRPVLIGGVLEASYPSSTTVLTMCVIPTAILQLRTRMAEGRMRGIVTGLLVCFTAFMVLGRAASGVHWLTDIIGGALLSAGLVLLYDFFCQQIGKPS